MGVDAGTSCILERIAHGVADDSGLMGFAALPAAVSGFDVFLGIVPEAAAVAHEERYQESAYDVPGKETADCGDSADEADDERDGYREEACGKQFAER